MKTEILISCDDWENRVAVLDEGALAEIYFEREEKVIGSIYKGRVENVLPGMGACFVNIGLGRNAFLYVDDIMRDPINIGETEITDRRRGNTVGELLHVGDDVLVQIVKEPRGLKGARVSTNVSLPGRYLVLMPTGRYSGVSSRIEDVDERNRLKQIMRRVRPEGMATIVRTAAQNVSEAELIADLGVQLRLWHGILESYQRATAPALLHKDLNLVHKAVRDFMTSDVQQVVIDSKEHYDEIRSTMSLLGPQYLGRLKLFEGPGNLFAVRGIDDELQKLLKPKIMLPSGGHLVIESTEALTVIDVNTGKFTGGRNLEDTLVRTNLEAAAEVARQVRLRDIGGIIVVDFIDMAHERSRQQVIDTLTNALRRDRTRSTIQVFSNLGLLEFTRKRIGKDLAGQLRSDCPYCGGLGDVMSSETLAIGLLRQIRQRGLDGGRGRKYDVVSDPSVATQLLGWYHEELDKLAKQFNLEIHLFVEPQRHRENIVFEAAKRQRKALPVGKEVEADLVNARMPDPASGVAVVEHTLVEVKDASNGAGQTVKLRINDATPNFAHASLAEPLAAGKRRRRGRGRGKTEAEEAPKPTPPPLERPTTPVLAYGVEDEEPQPQPRPRRRPTAAAELARPSRQAPGRDRGGRRDQRVTAPQPLVVGGEGDIDYDDDEDESAVVVTPQRMRPAASAETAEEPRDGGARRRRRRGRVGRRDEADRVSATPRAAVRRQGEEEEEFGETGEAPPARQHRLIGPIRQLYGAPLEIEPGEPTRHRKPQREEEPARRPSSQQRGRARHEREAGDDDLELVVTPGRPAPVKLDRVSLGDARKRAPSRERERERGEREERGRERGRGRGPGRPREQRAQRTGPSIRVLYAPPEGDATEAQFESEDEAPKRRPVGRYPRGPMIGKDPNAPPLAKGKVRQLWPPPEGDEPGDDFSETHASTATGETSLFVSDERDREERRRRARERAQARRDERQDGDDVADDLEGNTTPAQAETFPDWQPSGPEPSSEESGLGPSSLWAPIEIDRDEDGGA